MLLGLAALLLYNQDARAKTSTTAKMKWHAFSTAISGFVCEVENNKGEE